LRTAAIGIGSNSLRLLVADRKNGQITAVLRKREGLRVFASLNQNHEISSAMITQACTSVNMLRQAALHAGAQTVHLFATSAVRDANNQQMFADALFRETSLRLEILSGETEAKLSFIGATDDTHSGMIDIGGGSTEIVIGRRNTIAFACSLQAGAVRLYRQIPIHCREDALRAKQTVKALIVPYQAEIEQLKTPTEWVGVGGTLTALASCVQNIDWKDHDRIHGFIAAQSDVRRITETLAGMTQDQRRMLHSIPPDREDIIVHGFAILLGCMETLRIPKIKVSRKTNLDGYLTLMTADE